MRAAAFALERPTTIAEAIALLGDQSGEHGDHGGARVRALAGGQTLIAQLTRRELVADRLVDLGGIDELRRVTVDPDGTLRLGAMVTLATVEDDPAIAAGWPLLAEAVRHVAHRPLRNRSTVGGCIAFGDPPAEVPLALRVLGAAIARRGPLITEIAVPPVVPGAGHGFCETAPRVNDRATAVAAALAFPGGEPVCVGLATADRGPIITGPGSLTDTAVLGGGYPARAALVCARRATAQALERCGVRR